ncbi:MAG: hypothetical protein HQL66_03275 [Magnetococcales bacterium]|nr:hypothetical protein [Magnetococcales bacterium]
MRTLNGVALPDGTLWRNRRGWSAVAQTSQRTLDCRVVMFSQAKIAGQPIDLVMDEPSCWPTLAEVQVLTALADQAGSSFPFVWDDFTANVMFRHEEPPAAEFHQLLPGIDDYFVGIVRLVTI